MRTKMLSRFMHHLELFLVKVFLASFEISYYLQRIKLLDISYFLLIEKNNK